MKFRDCTSMNSTENIQEGYRNGLSKTALGLKNCKQQLFTLIMCLPACLWAQIAKTLFNYTITAPTLLAKMWWLPISKIDSSVSSIRKKISYRKHIHHKPSSKNVSRCREKRVAPCFVRQLKLFPEVRTNRVESMKTKRWKIPWLNSFSSRTSSSLVASLFAPHLCADVWRVLTWR